MRSTVIASMRSWRWAWRHRDSSRSARKAPNSRRPKGQKVYEEWSTSYAAYDPELAGQLLDEAGVVDIDGDGFRERPDGEPLDIIVDLDVQ